MVAPICRCTPIDVCHVLGTLANSNGPRNSCSARVRHGAAPVKFTACHAAKAAAWVGESQKRVSACS